MNQPKYVFSLRIVCLSFIAGLTLFSLISCFVISQKMMIASLPDLGTVEPYKYYIAILLVALALLAGQLLFNRKIAQAREHSSLQQKLETYREATLLRAIATEFPALALVVLSMLQADMYFILIAAIAIVSMVYRLPSLAKIALALQLDYQESEQLTTM